jgi:hypothetical protein
MSENGNDPPRAEPTLDALITELIECGGVLSQIVAHMAFCDRAGYSAPDAPPPGVVLRELLTGVLKPIVAECPSEQTEATTVLLRDVTRTICDEIMFVPVEEMERLNRRQRRARSHARRRR